MNRRGFFQALAAVGGLGLVPPSIVRAASLMKMPTRLRVLFGLPLLTQWEICTYADSFETTRISALSKEFMTGLVRVEGSVEIFLPNGIRRAEIMMDGVPLCESYATVTGITEDRVQLHTPIFNGHIPHFTANGEMEA